MKILGIVASMRKNGKTNLLMETVLESAKRANPQVQTEVLQISELKIESCRGCTDYCQKHLYQCIIEDDLPTVFNEMKRSEAIVIGSPLYFTTPSRLTALIERLVSLSYFYETKGLKEPEPLEGKPCGFLAVCADYDVRPVLQHLFNFALHLKMKPVTIGSYPYLGVGANSKLEKDKDLNPIKNAKALGRLLVEVVRETACDHLA